MKTIIKSFLKMVQTEIKIYMREPVAAMIAITIPVFFILIIMEEIMPMDPYINYIIPSLIVMMIASNTLYILPVFITTYREIKYFKRLNATPISHLTLMLSLSIANFVMTMVGILTLLVIGILFYNAEFKGDVFIFSAGFVLIVLCMTFMGIFIASLCRTTRSAQGVGGFIFFVLMFFSDIFIPLELQPDWVGDFIAPFLPTSYGVTLITGLWNGEPLYNFSNDITVLIGFLILMSMASVWKSMRE